ncbi:MAG: BLUF domain-containing protein [Pseudomonadota bacterium]
MPLKTLLYISESTESHVGKSAPSQLWKILRSSRLNNARLSLSGVLSYSHGKYVQVLEGESDSVDSMIRLITTDFRHTELDIVLHTQIEKPSFPTWPMRFIGSIGKDKSFNNYISTYEDRIDTQGRRLLGHFLPSRFEALPSDFEGQVLALSAWPSFADMPQTKSMLSLSARLVAAPCLYEDLIASKECSSEEELNLILARLNKLNLLVFMDSQPHDTRSYAQPFNEGLYVKLKDFLGLQ